MNFRHMPQLDWPFAYPLLLVAMVVMCRVLCRGLRRTGWL
jgi:magnesium transporter